MKLDIKLPLVSVIMPAYNAGKYIAETIESVLQQTYTTWELIIIDDGSVDNTKEVIAPYLLKDNRIKYFYQQNGRQGKARNRGIQHSKGKYIAFLDADDLWLPNRLISSLQILEEEKVDLVFSDSYVFTGRFISDQCKKMNISPGRYEGKAGLEAFLRSNKIPILTVLIKSDALKSVDGFTEDVLIQNAEDYHLWLKLLINGFSFYGSPQALTAYRMNTDSVTVLDRTSSLQGIHAISSLAEEYPQLRPLMNKYLKFWIRNSLEVLRTSSGKEFRQLLDKNFRLTGYNFYTPVLYVIDVIAGRSVSIRMAYFILNYF